MENLLRPSKRLAASARADDSMPAITLAQDTVDGLDEPTDLSILAAAASEQAPESTVKSHEVVIYFEASLRNPLGIHDDSHTASSASTLLTWLLEVLHPPIDLFGWRSAFASDPHDEVSPSELHRYRLLAIAGLRALSSLLRLCPDACIAQPIEVAFTLAAFTNSADPWTRAESYSLAAELLARYESALDRPFSILVPEILQKVVRPAFSKQRQPVLTPAGRAAIAPNPVEAPFGSVREAEEKPWKFETPWVVTVFAWCLQEIETKDVPSLYPQLTPPTLALLDDGAIPFRVRGLLALRLLLTRSEAGSLQRTGLGAVFEQAVVPMLALLPTLTEEPESLLVLEPAYATLRQLADVRFTGKGGPEERVKALDRVLRAGIIRGAGFAGDYPRIGALLARELGRLVDAMGIYAVKHLKSVVPLMVDNICNPFVTAAPALIVASGRALQTIILNCWPRIQAYAGEILKGVAVCWCRISEEPSQDGFDEAKTALRDVLKLLRATLANDEAALKDVATVLESDERLQALIGT